MAYSLNQKQFILESYFRNGTRNQEDQRVYSIASCITEFTEQYRNQEFNYDTLSRHVRRIIERFRTTRSLPKGKSSGCRTVLTQDNVENIRENMNRNPTKSLRRLSQQTAVNMHMVIWWGYEFGDFMIYGLKVNSVGGLVGACFGCAGLAILFEYLKLLQAQHRSRQLAYRAKQIRSICPQENAQLLNEHDISTIKRIGLPLIDIVLWIFTFNMAYLMMLTVMLYNGWIFISVVLGSGLGYFLFGQRFMKINLQNCQVIRSTFCMRDCEHPDEDALRRARRKAKFNRY